MRMSSSSRPTGRRAGASGQSISARAKREAKRVADRKRFAGRARYWPGRCSRQLGPWGQTEDGADDGQAVSKR